MSELGTSIRRGAHRARREPLRVVLPVLVAVAAVAVAAVLDIVPIRDRPLGSEPAGRAGASAPSGDAAVPPGSAPSGDPKPAAPAPTTLDGERASDPEAADEQERAEAEVVVLNQTELAGLASDVADDLRGEGWRVSGTGNFRGTVPATTVYYPRGQEDLARRVAADLPGRDRVRPRFGNLSTSRLTVVVTEDLR